MKKLFLLLIFVFTIINVKAQFTTIPDPNFESALNAYDNIPGDGQVPTDNISGVTDLNLLLSNISDLTGIEAFTSLQNLNCVGNQLTSLDVSDNTNLITLNCSANNNLTNLNLGVNTNLIILNCGNADLSSLDVSTTPNLQTLICSGNRLTDLNVNSNTALTYLSVSLNNLTSLNVSNNNSLATLVCNDNDLTSLNLGTISSLTDLRCHNNRLTSLDVSNNTGLETLWCNTNQLTGGLLLADLPVLLDFNATINVDLDCIEVADENLANDGGGQYINWQKDPGGAEYSEDCGVLSTEDFSLDNMLNISPNPATEIIQIEIPYQIQKVFIYNLQGQKVLESKSETINVEKLQEGLYFVKVQTTNNKKFQQKIVISAAQ